MEIRKPICCDCDNFMAGICETNNDMTQAYVDARLRGNFVTCKGYEEKESVMNNPLY